VPSSFVITASRLRGAPLHTEDLSMTTNPLLALMASGQSIWLDDIRRGWLDDGTLARLIEEDGVTGVTSNPSIFEKAITQGAGYDDAIATLAGDGADAARIYEALVVEDVGRAADLLGDVYRRSGGRDGFVSLEVSPHLAHDAVATVAEARALWLRLDRPNVMIKVPATRAGLIAVRELIAEGINVNVTLLFGLARYREVVDAFMSGIERRSAAGVACDRVASVASFFLSRIDTLVDERLDRKGTAEAGALRGQAAIACARLAYQHFLEWTASPRWRALAVHGAHPQRLLWASTSTKDKSYSDIRYVEALIAPDTVNTLPFDTLTAYRHHGCPAPRIADDLDAARALPARLAGLGIDLQEVADTLELEGLRKFIEPHDALLAALSKRASGTTGTTP
jgi:transaldolase